MHAYWLFGSSYSDESISSSLVFLRSILCLTGKGIRIAMFSFYEDDWFLIVIEEPVSAAVFSSLLLILFPILLFN